MAKIRIGFGTELNIGSEVSGIGTDNSTNTKQVLGNIHATNAKAVGISTFNTYSGFIDKKAKISNDIDINSQAGTVIGDIIISGNVTVASGSSLSSGVNELTVTNSFSVPTGDTDSRIHCQTAGSMRFNEGLGTLEFYTGDHWKTVNSSVDVGNSSLGLKMIGKTYPNTPGINLKVIEAMSISSGGNATDFGDMITAGQGSACSSDTRAFSLGAAYNDTIEYVAFSSKGDGQDFGNLTDGRAISTAGSSSTRGIMAGGWSPGNTNVIDYWEMATTGNALDFGDLVRATNAHGSTNSPTRMLVMGGRTPSVYYDEIQSITIASKGNAVDVGFWSWEVIETNKGTISSGPRGICGGTGPNKGIISTIASVDMASAANSTIFGDLSAGRRNMAGTSSKTRGLFAGGMDNVNSPNFFALNTIEYITIQTEGDAIDFGDLAFKTRGGAAASNCHGGLGGF